MNIPYIGITDFMNYSQVEHMLSVFRTNQRPGQNRRLHVGVMMSYKTLHGIKSKWSSAFPKNESIPSIFASTEAMNCLHYADYDNVDFARSLELALCYCGPGVNALQLDMVWPDPLSIDNAICAISREKPIEVILQVGENAIDQVGGDPDEVAYMLSNYEGIISHVLLDKSMGKGLGLNSDFLLPFIWSIRKKYPDLGITIAGGLGPNSMDLIKPIISEFNDISIDAQGRLRPSHSALDPIDWSMAEEYLKCALTTLT